MWWKAKNASSVRTLRTDPSSSPITMNRVPSSGRQR